MTKRLLQDGLVAVKGVYEPSPLVQPGALLAWAAW
eukprot:CAMPEP_0196667040 /NCGR_PEP_ID=MMETSP1086-20130531/64860_1 /TAXON_ID=77921 /ORGANISM="Cyanoptyche  gloeocystis , Strain SAG4.97" /LENGTH=34 /DNA_ID= /DNA_START= /DNA_END= /DNA_ORIENTATION=